jgi:hypothetical protein
MYSFIISRGLKEDAFREKFNQPIIDVYDPAMQ